MTQLEHQPTPEEDHALQQDTADILSGTLAFPDRFLRAIADDGRMDIELCVPNEYYPCGLQEHLERVVTAFDRYFSETPLPGWEHPESFRVLLGLHAIGLPFTHESPAPQSEITRELFDRYFECGILPFTHEELRIAKALVKHDPIGRVLRGEKYSGGKGISERLGVEQLKEMHAETNLDARTFFDLLTIYYQCDAVSFTRNFGGPAFGLDFLFVTRHGVSGFLRHEQEPRLLFRGMAESIFLGLRDAFVTERPTPPTA